MELKDLRLLEIGLELYRREDRVKGQSDAIVELMLRAIREDIHFTFGSVEKEIAV